MITKDRLNSLSALVEAEQAGSFAKAGERLGLSPSAVGKAIARLEGRLGVRLFHRTTRKLSLTEEGRGYYESCVRALAELEAAELALADARQAPAGVLRANLPDLFGRQCLAPILMEAVRAHPHLRLELSFANRFVDLAEDGLDLVVRIGELPDTGDLVGRRIGHQQLILCAAPAYLRDAPPLAGLPDLAAHACLTQLRGRGEEPWHVFDDAGAFGRLPVRGRHRFSALDVLADAATSGMGIAQLPLWLVRERLKAGHLLPVLPALARPRLPIQVLWLQSPVMPPRVRVAVDALARGLAGFDADEG